MVKVGQSQVASDHQILTHLTLTAPIATEESKVLSELKKGVDAAASIGFRSREAWASRVSISLVPGVFVVCTFLNQKVISNLFILFKASKCI